MPQSETSILLQLVFDEREGWLAVRVVAHDLAAALPTGDRIAAVLLALATAERPEELDLFAIDVARWLTIVATSSGRRGRRRRCSAAAVARSWHHEVRHLLARVSPTLGPDAAQIAPLVRLMRPATGIPGRVVRVRVDRGKS